jgi:hypothetical protein
MQLLLELELKKVQPYASDVPDMLFEDVVPLCVSYPMSRCARGTGTKTL